MISQIVIWFILIYIFYEPALMLLDKLTNSKFGLLIISFGFLYLVYNFIF